VVARFQIQFAAKVQMETTTEQTAPPVNYLLHEARVIEWRFKK